MNDKIKFDIQPTSHDEASKAVKTIYAQMTHDLSGVHEPFMIHSPSEDILLGLWSIYRESILATGQVPRGLKEAITVSVSDMNKCPWCFEAHSISLYAAGESKTVSALKQSNQNTQLDPKTQAIIEWTKATRTPNASILQDPPFTHAEAPGIIGTAIVYHYITKVVNVLLIESPLPAQGWAKTMLQRVLALFFASFVKKPIPSGETLQFLPDAQLPDDFAWAKNSDTIARAFAGFTYIMECSAETTIPKPVLDVVTNYVMNWNSEDPGISRAWVNDLIQPLQPSHQAIAKLALFGAISPHHIDDKIIAEFRQVLPSDEQLVSVLGWASYLSARRISSWLMPQQWTEPIVEASLA